MNQKDLAAVKKLVLKYDQCKTAAQQDKANWEAARELPYSAWLTYNQEVARIDNYRLTGHALWPSPIGHVATK